MNGHHVLGIGVKTVTISGENNMQYKDILSEIEYGAWSISDIRSLIYDLEYALEKRLEQQECACKKERDI